jgi:hypothetical protein
MTDKPGGPGSGRAPGVAFIALGVVFIAIGSSGRRAFIAIGVAFIAVGVAILVRQPRPVHNPDATMPQQHFGKTHGGSAPENYERYFVPAIGAPLAADLVDTAALRPGERVLDVACAPRGD